MNHLPVSGTCWLARLLLAITLGVSAPGLHAQGFDWGKVLEAATGISIPGIKFPDVLAGSAGAGEGVLLAASGAKGQCSSVDYTSAMTAGLELLVDEFEFLDQACTCTALCTLPPAEPTPMPAPGLFGVAKYWQGESIVEVVRQPGCSPLMGDISGMSPATASQSVGGRDGFYHVHAIPNLLLFGVAAALEAFCHTPAVADATPIYMSEVDPVWNLAMGPAISEPGSSKFAEDLENVTWKDVFAADAVALFKKFAWSSAKEQTAVAQTVESALCVGECLALIAGFEPFSFPPFTNCSGCNGLLAPYTGQFTAVGGRRAAELLVHRFAKLMMNRGLWQSTTVESCSGGVPLPAGLAFPKSEFRLQSIYPEAEKVRRMLGAPHLPVVDEQGKQGSPMKQDYVFQLWKRRECCAFTVYIPKICSPVPLPYV